MKVLRLYDLINDKETIIICYRYPRTAVLRQMDAEKIENERRKRKRQIFVLLAIKFLFMTFRMGAFQNKRSCCAST